MTFEDLEEYSRQSHKLLDEVDEYWPSIWILCFLCAASLILLFIMPDNEIVWYYLLTNIVSVYIALHFQGGLLTKSGQICDEWALAIIQFEKENLR